MVDNINDNKSSKKLEDSNNPLTEQVQNDFQYMSVKYMGLIDGMMGVLSSKVKIDKD